jgi:hypothetical protein
VDTGAFSVTLAPVDYEASMLKQCGSPTGGLDAPLYSSTYTVPLEITQQVYVLVPSLPGELPTSPSSSTTGTSITTSATRAPNHHSLSAGAAAGLTIGVVLFLALLSVLAWVFIRRYRSRKKPPQVGGTDGDSSSARSRD